MKTIKVFKPISAGEVTSTQDMTVSINIQSWYQKLPVFISLLTAIAGVFGIVHNIVPQVSWIVAVAGVLNTIATYLQKVVPSSSVVK